MSKPRIIFWDLETSLIQATTFTLRPDYLPHNGIIQDWSIISGAWKIQGEDKVNSVFTNEQVRLYRKMYFAGEITQKAISEIVGCNKTTVQYMLVGKTYKSVV